MCDEYPSVYKYEWCLPNSLCRKIYLEKSLQKPVSQTNYELQGKNISFQLNVAVLILQSPRPIHFQERESLSFVICHF